MSSVSLWESFVVGEPKWSWDGVGGLGVRIWGGGGGWGCVAPNLPRCSPTMLSWPNYSPCMGGCCPRGSRACWIKYNCPEHNAKNDGQPPPDKSVSVSPEQLCEKSHCPLSFGAVEDGQSGRRLRFQHGRQVEGTDTKCLLSRWKKKKRKGHEFLMLGIVTHVGRRGVRRGLEAAWEC